MGFGNVPGAGSGGFVQITAEVHGSFCCSAMRAEIEVDRGIVFRIAAQDEKCFDTADPQVLNQLAQRLDLTSRTCLGWFSVENCLADVSKGFVQPMGDGMNQWGLPFAGDDYRRAVIGFQVGTYSRQPFVCSVD